MAVLGFSHLGDTLRQARLEKRLSQLELAHKLGVTQATISHAENGRDLKLGTLVEIARALDLEPLLAPRKLVSAINTIVGTEAANRRNSIIHGADDDAPYTEEIVNHDQLNTTNVARLSGLGGRHRDAAHGSLHVARRDRHAPTITDGSVVGRPQEHET